MERILYLQRANPLLIMSIVFIKNANFKEDFVKLYFPWKKYGAGLATIGLAGAGEV
jgi:hypothetical protein